MTTPEQPSVKRRPQIFMEAYQPTAVVPTPRWIWAAIGFVAVCMVGYIIVSIDTSSIWLPLQ